ncbi:MAG: hypothetical protein IJD37_01590 [Clostridia bacterium]|nr:hypothetical protein [Clostridia bacterium]
MNGSSDIGDMISRLTENPEMMKTIMGIAGKLKENSDTQETHNYTDKIPHKPEYKNEDDCDCDKKDVCHTKNKKGDDAENLIRLLLALKPYVGVDRCDKIDGIIKILKFVQLSEKTGLFKSFL